MKKIFYLYTILLGTIIVGCNPMEDIHNDANANNPGVVEEVKLTLSDDDYDELDLSFGSFSSLDDAKSMLPDYLSELYPFLSNGSAVTVDYRLYIGSAFWLRDYSLKQEDYALSGSDLLGFQSDATPEDYLVDIISDNYSSPNEGDYVAASYFQYTGSAYKVTPTISLEENFDYGSAAGDLTTITSDWTAHSGTSGFVVYNTSSLEMTDYPSTNIGGAIAFGSGFEDVNTSFTSIIETGTVYASALINLSEVGDGTYFFHLMEEDGSFNYSARVGAKSDGSGNVLFGIGASSFNSPTWGSTPFDLNTTYLIVATYDIATGTSNLYVLTSPEATEPTTPEATNTGFAGNTANRIAIRQGTNGPTGTIDGIRVANTWSAIMTNDVLDDETVGSTTSNKVIYTFTEDGWEIATDGVYLVSDEDFTSMGIETFGSSTQPDGYLPTFLNLKFPFAQEGEELNVLYSYVSSSSGAQTRGNSYTKIDGVWVGYQSTIDSSLQFGKEDNTWIPDNTIRYTLVRNGDYEYMASQLTDPEYSGLIGNLASYGDFDYNWSDAQIQYALAILLDNLDPNAAEGQKYLLTYVIYDSGENEYTTKFIKTNGSWVVNE
ncbi:hypothetical protein [Thalassobellus suaedae]|uniref:DUF5017 domain-containing protein n=1 Tax=Thalassobellus suaedae TaxID=3074124 RepID=A0ABY9Y6P3_9FLAO|nr:hypothetical protein RHP49_05885 [Flavobacteriaceae bacterium HL-DH10]